MTSKEGSYLVPDAIEPELDAILDRGVGKIEPPSLKLAQLGDDEKTRLYQIWCHSPRVRSNSLGLCNHSFGAIICNVSGQARFSMLLECPKCRSSYIMTLEANEFDKEPIKLIDSKVVILNRAAQMFMDTFLDKEKDTWIKIHEKNY